MKKSKGARYPKHLEWKKGKTAGTITLAEEVGETIGRHAEDMHLLLDRIYSGLRNGNISVTGNV